MQINANDTLEVQIDSYRKILREQIANDLNFWNAGCAGRCGSKQTHYVVADEYFDSPAEAFEDGVKYGQKVCRRCYKYMGWNSRVLIQRPLVSLKKRIKCQGEKCLRVGTHFIMMANKRRHLCANCCAIHSEYTQTFFIDSMGKVCESTDALNDFYHNHIKYSLTK